MDNNINLSVSEEVISTIVEKTVMSVPGVYDIPGGIIDGITNILGSKKTRGIKVEINDKTITLDVYVIVEYGVKIPDIAWDIQDKVKKTLEEIGNIYGVTKECIRQTEKRALRKIREDKFNLSLLEAYRSF